MGRVTQRRKVHKYVLDGSPNALEFPVRHREDVLAVEEPLEIRIGTLSFSVTMRTPGDDFDLVAGFLVSEGVIWEPEQLVSLRFCAGEDENGVQTFNVVEAQLRPDVQIPETGRNVYTSSSCGICGTDSIEAVHKSSHYSPAADTLTLPAETLASLPGRLREAQAVFDVTGGVHAAGLFSIKDDGDVELLCLREDVGRHNAVDKVVGWALRERLLPLSGLVLQVSGRASFELVQKAALAGIPVLAAVSAPSSLAVELAEASGITLAGFSRGTSLNVYAGHQRITLPAPAQLPAELPG
ncbi:formate dehydrogenase accessory sulfurtransferase FdhD [Arthrobacter sp. CDRTa11]|uniref:formate dehydrogenase accessory sulfurtransferase FdhD n=1 Tax=Arthrobacter sp. CDRTa11 TaxID=2651199 RepID=UPI0022658595|nr:formate dehydrogenase accessory sulfurtransferase FdhD [Arthrobacter sp. CDRTa11]UZX01998.1 formate dehydrogenase accessory sulfurtransferase FdhD [Arthrobacter sp. CDRTa11]